MLMDGLLGHHLFTDRYKCSTVGKLGSHNTSMTGTIVSNHRLPPAIKGIKLQKGETKSFTHGQNLCLVWRNKRSVYMASNACGSGMVTLPSKIPGKPARKKPK